MRKLIFAAVLLFAKPAVAAVVISSSVTSLNGLFTYNYAIDNIAGSIPVDEFDIVVARPPNQPDLTPVPPSSFTSPAGWSFNIAVGGTDPVSGGLWEWQALNTAGAIQSGSSLSGFSFTTNVAPTQSALDNYFLLSDSFNRIQIGNISAPEVAIAHPVPEPSTWAMLLIGFAGIGFAAYRSKRSLITA
jgi:PEP-CTERM motif-containing protein